MPDLIPVKTDWYDSLVSDCKAIITEAVFQSRWALVEGYHLLGERIVNDGNFVLNAKGNGSSVTGLSKSVGVHERDIYRAIQFYNKFPVLDAVPEGKNISWNKIITKYLPDVPPPAPIQHADWCDTKKPCNCGAKHDRA